jgi:hypothetical protein
MPIKRGKSNWRKQCNTTFPTRNINRSVTLCFLVL